MKEKNENMSNEEMFKEGWRLMMTACKNGNWGDPFSYARSREIMMAIELGHQVADTLSGADGFDENNKPVEYKSTIRKSINATYNGISVQTTWIDQLEYLEKEKIGKYKEHYAAKFSDDPENPIKEMYMMKAESVFTLLKEKLKRQFFDKKDKKDPRLGASLSAKEIKGHGTRIL